MRRSLLFSVALIAALVSWPAQPRGQRVPTLSRDLLGARGERVRIIVQSDDSALSKLTGRHRQRVRRQFTGGVSLDLSRAEFEALRRDSGVTHISSDLPVTADMAVTNKVTAAEKVWAGTSGLLGIFGEPGYNGGGITVAVVDSGIAPHSAIGSRVIGRADFVSFEPPVAGDPFGHGTHVAGMIGGTGTAAYRVTGKYNGGSAPAIRFVDVRVLGRTGVGYTSDVIAGIDWIIANKSRYNIRVINLSLGHPVVESASTDPLCRAVARAVKAGIVVVASAGNYGRTPTGAPVLGGITSPGNSPDAITVGAIDTFDTTDERDDRIAPYSSRGPTAIDLAVKPDVVAPGTRIVSLEAANSYIASSYPSFHVAGAGSNAYMKLSGTSMSAAIVSGGVALLLDAEPGLSPAQVKLALQMGTRFVPDGGLVGSGTGSVDFERSLKFVQQGLLGSVTNALSSILGLSSGAAFVDRGTLIDRVYDRSGIRLLSLLDLRWLLDSADHLEAGVLNLLGLNNPLAGVSPNRLVWGEVSGWTENHYIVWGTAIQSPEGDYIVWGTADDSDYIVWGTGNGVVVNDGR